MRKHLILIIVLSMAFPSVAGQMVSPNAGTVINLSTGSNTYEGNIQKKDSKWVKDTCQANTIGEAKRIFRARYPDSKQMFVKLIKEGLKTWEGNIQKNDGAWVKDNCQARSAGHATRIFKDRYPGAKQIHVKQK